MTQQQHCCDGHMDGHHNSASRWRAAAPELARKIAPHYPTGQCRNERATVSNPGWGVAATAYFPSRGPLSNKNKNIIMPSKQRHGGNTARVPLTTTRIRAAIRCRQGMSSTRRAQATGPPRGPAADPTNGDTATASPTNQPCSPHEWDSAGPVHTVGAADLIERVLNAPIRCGGD